MLDHPAAAGRPGSRLLIAVATLLLACSDDGGTDLDGSVGSDAGPACASLIYESDSGDLQRWPEPRMMVADPTSPTGRRFEAAREAWSTYYEGLGSFGAILEEELAGFDGFGINGEAFFRFTGDPAGAVEGGLALLPEGGEATVLESTTTTAGGADQALFVAALDPLPERARVVAWARSTGAGCTESTDAMRAAIAAEAETVDALVAAGAVDSADELVALTVFHTGTFAAQAMNVAAAIAEGPAPALTAPPSCEASAAFRVCRATMTLRDFRGADGTLDPFPPEVPGEVRTYDVPLTIWLPLEAVVSAPAAIFGHGLSSPVSEGEVVAELAAPAGVVTVAIPALKHEGHPTFEDGGNQFDIVLDFFALDPMRRGSLRPAVLRDHGRQTVWERLQLLRFLRSAPDLDGDGESDVDPSRLGYVGGSLGAIMGPQFLAGAPDLRGAVMAMPGGRLGSLLTASPLFLLVFQGQRPPEMSALGLRRFIPVAQMLIDPGDPATFGSLAVSNHPEPRPSLLVSMAMGDSVVPNSSSYDVSRALGVPLVAPLEVVPGFEVVDSPLTANVDAQTTAGLIQVDQALVGGEVVPATHLNMATSEPALSNSFDFLLEAMDGTPVLREARIAE